MFIFSDDGNFNATTCTISEIKSKDTNQTCHDCGCKEGEIHKFGCDMERCPFCHGQLLSCDCRYTELGYTIDKSKPYCGLPKEIFEHGLTDEQ